MEYLLRYYRILNILSLDIVAGSVACALFFARIFNVAIRPYGLMALGLTVWCIYTTDHLMDARNINKHASTNRHRFHQRYFKTILICLVIAAIINAINLFFVRKQVFEWGIVLAITVCVYLIIQRYLRFLKEIFVAILYTCGVLLPSMSVTDSPVSLHHFALVIQFALIALLNLLIFSWFDRDHDQKDKQNSFVTMFGEPITRSCIWTLFMMVSLISVANILFNFYRAPSWILFFMSVVLVIIFTFKSSFIKHEYYRLLGDAIFLLPVFYLL